MSDGGTSSDSKAELGVWGANLLDTPFADEIAGPMANDEADGWRLGYRTAKPAGASWSGSRGGRVLTMRAVPLCTDRAAFFRLDYPAAAVAAQGLTLLKLAMTGLPPLVLQFGRCERRRKSHSELTSAMLK